MGFLVDTSVLSALAPDRQKGPKDVRNWLLSELPSLHLSIVSVIEVEQGIAKLRRLGSARRADLLADWLRLTAGRFAARLFDLDMSLTRDIGILADCATGIGRNPGWADIVIAATARVHGLTVLTRNVRHFEPLGVAVLDPFAAPP